MDRPPRAVTRKARSIAPQDSRRLAAGRPAALPSGAVPAACGGGVYRSIATVGQSRSPVSRP
ncbi:MAG: hypothetical protein OXU61_09885 [Gammaproteobacteria bacterium]|nr:hypothetical protein [Gammaproteobacteria bacterium]